MSSQNTDWVRAKESCDVYRRIAQLIFEKKRRVGTVAQEPSNKGDGAFLCCEVQCGAPLVVRQDGSEVGRS